MFSAGVPVFFANMALAAWIKVCALVVLVILTDSQTLPGYLGLIKLSAC